MADIADKLIERFGPLLESIELNSLKQASFLESVYNLTVVSDIEQARQISILSRIANTMDNQLALEKDAKQDRERAENLEDISETEGPTTESGKPTAEVDEPVKLGLGELLSGALLTPFVFSFAKGFLEEITDGLLELTAGGVAGVISMFQGRYNALVGAITGPIYRIFDAITDSFKGLSNLNNTLSNRFAKIRAAFTAGLEGTQMIVRNVNGTFRSATLFDDVIRGVGAALNPVISVVSKIGGFLTAVGTTAMDIFSKIPGVTTLTRFIGRIAWPFTMIMGLIDGISEFRNTEGSMIEKILAGVGGFLGEVIGAPLDLLKGAVAWILDKLGFDGAAEFLSSFNIEQQIRDIFGSINTAVSSAISVVTDLFTFGEGDRTALGALGKLTDIVYAPVNLAINFVRGLFGFTEDGGEPFKLQDWIEEKAQQGIEWVKGLFSWAGNAIADGWEGLSELASSAVESVGTWIKSKFTWAEGALTEGSDFMVNLFNETIEKVKEWFRDAFDFLPTIEEIKATLTALLPSWMRPEGAQEARQKLEEEIAEQRRYISEGDMRNWYGRSREAIVQELENELANLPQGRRGGVFNMPESGGLAMLHGQEAVIPLDSAEGKSILSQKTEAIAQQTTAMATRPAPVMIQGGATTNSPVTNNNNNSKTTIVNNLVDPTKRLNHMPM